MEELINTLIQSGVAGAVILWFMWRDKVREADEKTREAERAKAHAEERTGLMARLTSTEDWIRAQYVDFLERNTKAFVESTTALSTLSMALMKHVTDVEDLKKLLIPAKADQGQK